jgi:hypothetical protein
VGSLGHDFFGLANFFNTAVEGSAHKRRMGAEMKRLSNRLSPTAKAILLAHVYAWCQQYMHSNVKIYNSIRQKVKLNLQTCGTPSSCREMWQERRLVGFALRREDVQICVTSLCPCKMCCLFVLPVED